MNGVYFNGKYLINPGIYSSIDTEVTTTKVATSGGKIVGIIGTCTGGEPGVVQFFDSPDSAKKVLKSGYLLDAMNKAWNPVSATKEGLTLGGAHTIACIRANKATKATAKIGGIDVESKDWGANSNGIVVSFSEIDNADGDFVGIKANILDPKHPSDEEIISNLGVALKVADENVSVVADESKITSVKYGEGEEQSIDITESMTIKDLATALSLVGVASITIGSGASSFKVAECHSSSLTSGGFILASTLLVMSQVSLNSNYISMSLGEDTQASTVTSLLVAPTSSEEDFQTCILSGGTEGTVPASWAEYYNALSRYDIYYIVPLTDDMSILAEGQAYVDSMSSSFGKERRLVCGGGNNLTVAEACTQAQLLQDPRVQYVYPGMYDLDSNNILTLYPAFILASQHAGRCAYLEEGEATTNDTYRMAGIEKELEPEEISTLLQAGVVTFKFIISDTSNNTSVKCVQDITTSKSSTALYKERSIGVVADDINRDIKDTLENVVTGKRLGTGGLTSVRNLVLSILKDRLKKEIIVAYKDVSVVKDGDVTTINYSVAPVEPNNFTLIQGHFYSSPIVAKTEEDEE